MSSIAKRLALAAIALSITAGATLAQTNPGTQGCTDAERKNAPLGQKLNQSNGVICPPDVDPGMKAPTPEAGKTPVIPPPGSPGGNPNVQPK